MAVGDLRLAICLMVAEANNSLEQRSLGKNEDDGLGPAGQIGCCRPYAGGIIIGDDVQSGRRGYHRGEFA